MVNEDMLLAAIHAADLAERLEWRKRNKAAEGDHRQYQEFAWECDQFQRLGPRIDLEKWSGRLLTASEKIRHQQALRRLEAAGLVRIHGQRATRVRLTPAGVERLKQLEAAKP